MTATANPFQRATKRTARARVAFDGTSGSGKTWTALQWATELVADTGQRIALVDTERGSASLYAGHFDFDVLEMTPPYQPERLNSALRDAEAAGYGCAIVDSWTHFWSGEGGVLDLVDDAAARSGGNKFAAWQVGTPAFKRMVDTILAVDMHVIVTMRSKTEWVLEENERGKKVPRRVGMAPEQRAGVEYEFTMVGDIDLEHRIVFSKSRCDRLADAVIQPGRAQEAAAVFKAWLADGEPLADRNTVDAITSRVNAIEPKERRTECKRRFKEEFGPVAQLLASQVDQAQKLVGSFEEPDPPVPPPGSPATTDPTPPGPDGGGAKASRPDDVRVAEDEPQSTPEPTGSNCRQGEEAPASSPEAARLSPIDLARLADQAFPITKDDVPPRKLTWTKKRYRYTLTAAVTDGRTVHLDELTADEAIKLAGRFRDLIRARVEWEALEDGLRIGARVLPWVDPDTATVAV
jgi:hypothetical protein